MYYNRTECEKNISESPLFTLDRETAGFERESYNMIEYLFCYLMAVNRYRYEAYGSEIMETAMRCIRSYIPEKGPFLGYFNAAWKAEYHRIQGRRSVREQLRGVRVSREDLLLIYNYSRLRKSSGAEVDGPEFYAKIAEAMGIPVKKVPRIAEMAEFSVTGSSWPEEDVREPAGFSVEAYLESQEDVQELLAHIDAVFGGLQERQRPLVSELLTARVLPELEDFHLAEEFRFVCPEIAEAYARTGAVPPQQSIADKYGRNAASISRTMRQFLGKLRIQIEGGTEHGV